MATILIVEDRPVDRKMLATLLHSQGHVVVESANGEDALQLLAEIAPPDLIISDILMPTTDGHEFVRRLRQLPALAGTPVVFYTAVGATLEQAREIVDLRARITEFELAARRTSGQTKQAREEERASLSRMLHDQLGQILASLKMEVHSLGDHVPASNQNLTSKVELLIQRLEEAIEVVRKFSSELRPGVLDQLGLIAAIEWYVREFERESDIECQLDSTVEQVNLEPGRGISVYRVFQEALTNVQRHAEATRVTIRLRETSGQLTVSVADNGRGISQDALHSNSPGLLGMRERAVLLGGHLDIHRLRPHGTSVTLTTPLADRRRVSRE